MAPPRGKEESMRRLTWILCLLGLIAAGCAESPPPAPRQEARRTKPAPAPDARIIERKTATPEAQRGVQGTSPSTGEPVEIHRSR
jgi:hypothetical protein